MISERLEKLMNSTPRERIIRYKKLMDNAIPTLSVDYAEGFTTSHRKNENEIFTDIKKARAHTNGLLNIPITLLDEEIIIGKKSQSIRGACFYPHYAVDFLESMNFEEMSDHPAGHNPDRQGSDRHTSEGCSDIQMINAGKFIAEHPEYTIFSGKFIIARKDIPKVADICEYWKNRNLKFLADSLWKKHFKESGYIEKGWEIGLFTAPHDSCIDGRIVLNYPKLLSRGLFDIRNEIMEKQASLRITTCETSEKLAFYEAALITCDGMMNYADKCRFFINDLLREKNHSEERIRELSIMANALEQVPRYPARNFREAIQSFWLLYMICHLEGSNLGFSPGRLDQYLYPYYKRDIEEGLTDEETVISLLQELFIKMSSFEYFASFSWVGFGAHNLFQNCILGGASESGNTLDNDLSKMIVISQFQLARNNEGLHQPTLSIWVHDKTDDELMDISVQTIKLGVGYPAFFNFDITRQHMLKTGACEEDSYKLAMGGCTEPVIEGLNPGIVQAGFINLPKLLELTMNNGADPSTGKYIGPATGYPEKYADIRAAFLIHLKTAIQNWTSYFNYVMSVYDRVSPQIGCSIFIDDSIIKGKSLSRGGARYNNSPTTLSSGLVDVANSLAVFKKNEETEAFPFQELTNAIRRNFEGCEKIFKFVWQDVPKFGNNDQMVDDIFTDIFDRYAEYVREQPNYLGSYYDPSSLAISTPVPFGKVCQASAFGRKACKPISDGVYSPYPGSDRKGILSVFKSAVKFDGTKIRGGLLNIKLDPKAFNDNIGVNLFKSIVRNYIKDGGFHVQFNVIDRETMQDMIRNPEKYENKLVRVSGFTAKWGQLTSEVRQQIGERTLVSLD
ncbi:MAG: hypothetical protein HQK54_05340 [Oligoflexales bacterium]|nr:hypothetical protein [Oligoflexales bacterium]